MVLPRGSLVALVGENIHGILLQVLVEEVVLVAVVLALLAAAAAAVEVEEEVEEWGDHPTGTLTSPEVLELAQEHSCPMCLCMRSRSPSSFHGPYLQCI